MTKEEVLSRVLEEAKMRGLSKYTQEEYYIKTKLFQEFYDKPATELGLTEVKHYLYHLSAEKTCIRFSQYLQ